MPETGLRRFIGRTVVVTGAARGMGLAHAQRFASEGADVVMIDRDQIALNSTAEVLPHALRVVADLTLRSEVEAAVASAIDCFGRVDALVNNAGGALWPAQLFWEMSDDEYQKLFDVNVKSQWLLTSALVPNFIAIGGGKVVNISSIDAYRAARWPLYGAAKAAVSGLTRTMAGQLGPHNVCVNTIAPGYIDTKAVKAAITQETRDALNHEAMTYQSIKRIGQVEDVAAVAAFFASSDADFLTGQVLKLDGGQYPTP